MNRARYFQWIAVFGWFQTVRPTRELEALYGMLNDMWQEDRKACSAERLDAYATAARKNGNPGVEPDSLVQTFMKVVFQEVTMEALQKEILKLLTEHGQMHWGDIQKKLNGQVAGWDVGDHDIQDALDSLLKAGSVTRNGDRWAITKERFPN